jgi:hypothetical protein
MLNQKAVEYLIGRKLYELSLEAYAEKKCLAPQHKSFDDYTPEQREAISLTAIKFIDSMVMISYQKRSEALIDIVGEIDAQYSESDLTPESVIGRIYNIAKNGLSLDEKETNAKPRATTATGTESTSGDQEQRAMQLPAVQGQAIGGTG